MLWSKGLGTSALSAALVSAPGDPLVEFPAGVRWFNAQSSKRADFALAVAIPFRNQVHSGHIEALSPPLPN